MSEWLMFPIIAIIWIALVLINSRGGLFRVLGFVRDGE